MTLPRHARGDASGVEVGYRFDRQPEQLAKHIAVRLTERRRRAGYGHSRLAERERHTWVRRRADVRGVDVLQAMAGHHVRVRKQFKRVQRRTGPDPVALQFILRLDVRALRSPRSDGVCQLFPIGMARFTSYVARVMSQFGAADSVAECGKLFVAGDGYGDPCIFTAAAKHIVRRHPRVVVAAAPALAAVKGKVDVGVAQHLEFALDHCKLDVLALSGLTLVP